MAALLTAGASPAAASVTIGQTGDASASSCVVDADWAQPTVLSGNPYVVPGAGTITSWSINAGLAPDQQYVMKMYRRVSGNEYRVVGHAGPQTLTPGGVASNTFPASVKVQPGDVLGFHTVTDSNLCAIPALSDVFLIAPSSDLADGQSATFLAVPEDVRLNIQATFVPDNSFKAGKVKRNKNNGTATVSFNLPNAGVLTGTGSGAKVSSASAVESKTVSAPGVAKLKVKAKGSKRRTLDQSGKVTLKLKITYTPTSGDPKTQKLKVKLLKD